MSLTDWIGLSCYLQSWWLCLLYMLTDNILGKTQVYLSMFCLCWTCSVLVSCTHAHMLPYCCPNRELREHMAAMIFRGFFRLCEQGRVSVCAYRVYAWPSTSRSNTYMFGLCQWPRGIYRPNRSCHLNVAFAEAALLMTFYCTQGEAKCVPSTDISLIWYCFT